MTEKQVRYIALDRKVLVVAVEGEVNDWAAYIGAVEGNNHEIEWLEVKEHGSKLSRTVAEAIFPDFINLDWRY